MEAVSGGKGKARTEADAILAAKVLQWGQDISADTSNDYLANVRVVARAGVVSPLTSGVAASMPNAYLRAIDDEARREREIAACGDYVGEVGKRIGFAASKKGVQTLSAEPVTLHSVAGYATDYGYTTVLTFVAVNGSRVVWKASNTDLGREDIGKQYAIIGTVKAHSDYRECKQTIISRCAVTPA